MFDCTRGEPSLFVKGVFDEISILKLFARSVVDDDMALVCLTSSRMLKNDVAIVNWFSRARHVCSRAREIGVWCGS